MRLRAYVIFFLLAVSCLSAQELKLVGSADFRSDVFSSAITEKVEFVFNGSRTPSEVQALNLSETVDRIAAGIADDSKNRMVIEIVDESSNHFVCGYGDFNQKSARITPYIIMPKRTAKYGDTLKISDDMIKGNADAIGKALEVPVIKRIHLQVDKRGAEAYFKKRRSIIFPMDKATSRWITGATLLNIYILK